MFVARDAYGLIGELVLIRGFYVKFKSGRRFFFFFTYLNFFSTYLTLTPVSTLQSIKYSIDLLQVRIYDEFLKGM